MLSHNAFKPDFRRSSALRQRDRLHLLAWSGVGRLEWNSSNLVCLTQRRMISDGLAVSHLEDDYLTDSACAPWVQ